MFASISRGSSRVRKSYICSSCLCNIVAHPSPASTPVLNRVSHPNASAASSRHFSTTPANYKGKDDPTINTPADSKSAGPETPRETGNSLKTPKPAKALHRKDRRRISQATLPVSNSTIATDALRASVLADDTSVELGQLATTSTSRTKKKRTKVNAKKDTDLVSKASGEKVLQEHETTSSNQSNMRKTRTLAGRKKGKKPAQATLESEKTGDQPEEAKEKISKDAITTKGKTAVNVVKAIKVKEKLKGKTFKGISKYTSAESKTAPLAVRKVRSRGSVMTEIPSHRVPSEDSTSVEKDVKEFTASLGGAPSDSTGQPLQSRRALVELIQSGKLGGMQRLEAIKLLRRLLISEPAPILPSHPSKETSSGEQSLKDALLSKPSSKARTSRGRGEPRTPSDPNSGVGRGGKRTIVRDPPGPVKIGKGVTEYEIETIDSDKLELVPLESDGIPVPTLAYGLDRVLFNPGVYQLQDPRSKVFNFDPYLQSIMPAHEFDFDALKQYVTSSRDQTLIGKARAKDKKYTGSTSSMTSALAHFHFLLSAWRPITTGNLSKMFPVEYETFTALQRAPNAIFLRNRDGVYAIDADKQYDGANILMMLGKSMEKLLTLPTEDFEKYRKINSDQISEEERNADEAFHYTTMGDFLMRSQLDAYDPRLPGSGMFDLKTRAVISVRMDAEQYEEGRGYQIRKRHGEWESYEREYFDMIRAAFLKYSLQVRMGRMDGIFVAFHNTQRIFGFQYISLPEMDFALHGTEDTKIGDSEFKLSLELLNRVLDRATAKFPGKSLRLHFETRDAVTPFMYIFAEPVEEERIEQIQTSNKAKIEEFEKRVMGLTSQALSDDDRKAEWANIRAEVADSMKMDEHLDESEDIEDPREFSSSAEPLTSDALAGVEQVDEAGAGSQSEMQVMSEEELKEVEDLISSVPEEVQASIEPSEEAQDDQTAPTEANKNLLEESEVDGEENAASEGMKETQFQIDSDEVVVDEVAEDDEVASFDDTDPLLFSADDDSKKEILGMTLTIRNKLDGEYIERPRRLDNGEKWEVEYALEEVPQQRVLGLYSACLKRRKRTLVKSVDLSTDSSWNDKFIETIKRLSMEGKLWRAKEDNAERTLPLKTLLPVNGETIQERIRSESSRQAAVVEELEDSEEPGESGIDEAIPAATKSESSSQQPQI